MARPTAVSRRGRPRSLASEQAILGATLRLLVAHGYPALTMDAVAAAAGASKATIYRRWQSKEALVLAAFTQLPPIVPADRGALLPELLELFGQYQRTTQSPLFRSALPALIAACVSDPHLALTMETLNEQRRVPLRMVLQRAVRRGELPPDADLELAIDAIQGLVTVRGLYLRGDPGPDWPQRLFGFVLRGLGARR